MVPFEISVTLHIYYLVCAPIFICSYFFIIIIYFFVCVVHLRFDSVRIADIIYKEN